MRKGEGASPGTINRERSALLHMLNTMRPAAPAGLGPAAGPPARTGGKLVYLTSAESQRLLCSVQNNQSDHAHPFIMIALYTGLRHSQILNLRVRDAKSIAGSCG